MQRALQYLLQNAEPRVPSGFDETSGATAEQSRLSILHCFDGEDWIVTKTRGVWPRVSEHIVVKLNYRRN